MRDVNISGRDISTVNYEQPKENGGWIKLTVKIAAPVIIAAILYLIYKLTGIKLSDFGLK